MGTAKLERQAVFITSIMTSKLIIAIDGPVGSGGLTLGPAFGRVGGISNLEPQRLKPHVICGFYVVAKATTHKDLQFLA